MRQVVLSLGGSLVVPDKIDVRFLKNFRNFVLKYLKKNYRFVIVAGGGKTARRYQKAAAACGVSQENLDWIGISATHLNAELVNHCLTNSRGRGFVRCGNGRIAVVGGLKPGRTTDYVAVEAAKKYKTNMVINLTDVDYVYDKDPDKFPEAKPFEKLSWKEYFKIFGRKHKPGASYPFGLIASQLAEKLGIKVVILKGSNFRNLENLLQGKKFKGTIIG